MYGSIALVPVHHGWSLTPRSAATVSAHTYAPTIHDALAMFTSVMYRFFIGVRGAPQPANGRLAPHWLLLSPPPLQVPISMLWFRLVISSGVCTYRSTFAV